ncbi:unnamed protein product, partial [Dibothriocephalus latus]
MIAQADPKRAGGRGGGPTQMEVVSSNFLDFAGSMSGQGSCDFILMESTEAAAAAPTTMAKTE